MSQVLNQLLLQEDYQNYIQVTDLNLIPLGWEEFFLVGGSGLLVAWFMTILLLFRMPLSTKTEPAGLLSVKMMKDERIKSSS